MGRPRKIDVAKEGKKETEPVDIKLFGDWRESIEAVLESKKKERDALDHQVLLSQIELKNLQDAKAREQSQFELYMRQLKQNFDNEKNIKLSELNNGLSKLQFHETEIVKRLQDVDSREKRCLDLEELKHKLNIDRIEVEKLAVQAKDRLKEAMEKESLASDKLDKVSTLESEIKKEQSKFSLWESDLILREDKLKESVELQQREIKNLEEIRKSIEPRIIELSKVEDNIKLESVKLEEKKKELVDKIAEERNMFAKLDEEKSLMNLRRKELNEKEEAFKRKLLFEGSVRKEIQEDKLNG